MGISLWQLLIVLVIVLLLFGTKKLRSIGSDLGGAVKGFRGAMDGDKKKDDADDADDAEASITAELDNKDGDRIIEGEVTAEEKDKVKHS